MTRALAGTSVAAVTCLALWSAPAAAESCAPSSAGCALAADDIPIATSRYINTAPGGAEGVELQTRPLAFLQAPAPAAPAPSNPPSVVAAPAPAAAPTIHNPFDHDVDLTMSLSYNTREIGEMPVTDR